MVTRNKSVFYDFTDGNRKSEGLRITSENSRLTRDFRRVAKRECVSKFCHRISHRRVTTDRNK